MEPEGGQRLVVPFTAAGMGAGTGGRVAQSPGGQPAMAINSLDDYIAKFVRNQVLQGSEKRKT